MFPIKISDILQAVDGSLISGNCDIVIKNISIDSRNIKEDTLYIPIIGEKNDGHKFIPEVIARGAVAVLTSQKHMDFIEGVAYIYVKDTKKALQALASDYREKIVIPVIAITGSVGKTTTREMVATALSGKYKVFKTPSNLNSQIGVPLTIFAVDSDAEIAVLELGMSEPGEMTVISNIVRADSALITNVGITHIEQLKTRDNILHEKLSIQDGLKKGATLFVNYDNDLLMKVKAREDFNTVYYGKGSENYADNIKLDKGFPEFDAHIGKETTHIKLKVYGNHQISNAIAALTLADFYDVPLAIAAEKLHEFTGFKHRQQISIVDGITLIDDTYNASPVSMTAALNILNDIEVSGRKIAVLADMKELGIESEKLHFDIGSMLAEDIKIDILITLGKLAAEIAKGVRAKNKSIEIYEFVDREKMEEYINTNILPEDAILFKGSNSTLLHDTVDRFHKKEGK